MQIIPQSMARAWRIMALTIALIAAALPAQVAYARASILRSDPPDSALLPQAPQQIRVWLSETVDSQQVAVTLTDSAGRTYPTVAAAELYQPAAVGLADKFDPLYLYLCSLQAAQLPSLLRVELPAIAPGSYQLTWQVAGLRDQRPVVGSLVFAVHAGLVGDAASLPGARTLEAADLIASLQVRPNLPGQNFVGLQVVSSRRPAPAPIAQVWVRLTAPDGRQQMVEATPVAAGRWQISGEQLSQPGDWDMEITLVRPGMRDVVMRTVWGVAAVSSGERPAAPLLSAGVLVLLLIGGLALLRGVALRRSRAGAHALEVV